MNPMTTAILTILDQAPEGEILSAGDLLHLGPRAGVARCLSLLCKSGELFRIDRGLYVRRIATRFGHRGPSIHGLIDAMAKRTGEIIVRQGGKCANLLGSAHARNLFDIRGLKGSSSKLNFCSNLLIADLFHQKSVLSREIRLMTG